MKKVIAFVLVCMLLGTLVPCSVYAEDNVTYLLRDVNDGADTEVAMAKYQTYETEHFQIFWDVDGANSAKVTDEFLTQCETVLENCWDLYVNKMGMEPTSTSVLANGDKVTQYKTNVILMGTGITHYDLGADDWGAYGSVDTAGYPYFMCCLAAMNSPTVVAHEFGHSTHYAQGDNAWKDNIYLGPWFEAVANWYAEQYIYEYMNPYQTQLSSLYLRSNHLTKMNGRAYYEAWPLLQYLHEDPDNTGVYGEKFIQKLLSTNLGNTNVLFWEVLEKANGESITAADTVGMYASHMATMDFEHKANYNVKINAEMSAKTLYWQQRYTMLEQLGDLEDTYAVPTEKAPQAMGYNIIPLEFTPGEVGVKINPLTDNEGAHWRARLVIERNGETSYSELFMEGERITANVQEGDELYLTVAATPDVDTIAKHTIGGWATHSTESNYPYEDKTIYPYSVTIENAVPETRPMNSLGTMTIHPNGGGRKSFSAQVADTAYIGPNAVVFGKAQIMDNAVIDGYAVVGGNAVVKDNAYVGDYAVVYDRAEISGNARVLENACIYVDYKVGGNAVVKGSSLGLYDGSVTGEAITYGDWFEDMGYDISGGSFSGYHSISSDSQYAPLVIDGMNVRSYVPSLRARYEFNGNLRDTVAYSDAYGVNDLTVTEDYVSFDGEGYVALNKSVLYYEDARLVISASGEGELLRIGDMTLEIADGKAILAVDGTVLEAPVNEGFNELGIEFRLNEVILSVNGISEKADTDTNLLNEVRKGGCYLGYDFTGDVDYLRIFDTSCDGDDVFRGTGGEKTVFEADGSTGTLSSNGSTESSAWYGWKNSGCSVSVNGGLNVTGGSAGTIAAPGYETDKFVLEFKPGGGKTYPDHGVTDTDGEVLFAYRYAADANAIHAGRGEINDSLRGAGYVTDTTGQKRLEGFMAEKLYSGSIREDRGALAYEDGDTVRIIAENRVWNEEMETLFESAENKSSALDGVSVGDDVYTVAYVLLDEGLEVPVSVSVYKGKFEGFGGFKVAGGTSSTVTSYKGIKIYAKVEPTVTSDGERITVNDFNGKAIAIFAVYNDNALEKVSVKEIGADGTAEIDEGFEDSTVMIFTAIGEMVPVTKPFEIGIK